MDSDIVSCDNVIKDLFLKEQYKDICDVYYSKIRNKELEYLNFSRTSWHYICASFYKTNDENFIEIALRIVSKYKDFYQVYNLMSYYYLSQGDYFNAIFYTQKVIEVRRSLGKNYGAQEKKLFKIKYEQNEAIKAVKIYADEDLAVRYVKSGKEKSKILFITFWGANKDVESGNMTPNKLYKREGYAEKFILDSGWDLIAINKTKYNFYQDLSGERFRDLVQPYLKNYEKVFLYGSSGGGYAALFYATYINCYAIAYSPRIRIDPSTQMLVRTHDPEMVHPVLSSRSSKKKAFVFYDPKYAPDHNYVTERVKETFSNLVLVKLPYTGHGPHFLAEVKIIKDVVRQCVALKSSIEIDFLLRKKSRVYHQYLIRNLIVSNKIKLSALIAVRGSNVLMSMGDLKGALKLRRAFVKYLKRKGLVMEADLFKKYYSVE